MERVRQFFNEMHLGTRVLMLFMILLYIVTTFFVDPNIMHYYYFNPQAVIMKGQVWRIITGALLHGGLIHLLSNMMTFAQLGVSLESRIGTFSFFYHILLFTILTAFVDIFVAWFMYIGGNSSEFYGNAVGFSGVLFALLVIDNEISGGDERSIFGLFLVPSWTYPWAMLVLLSVIIPNVSLLGHFSGIIVGYMYNLGWLKWLSLSRETCNKLERKLCCCLRDRFGYVHTDGVTTGDYQPYAVFHHEYHEDTPAQTAGRTGFQGRARTVDTAPPAQPSTHVGRPHTLDDVPSGLENLEDLRPDQTTREHHEDD